MCKSLAKHSCNPPWAAPSDLPLHSTIPRSGLPQQPLPDPLPVAALVASSRSHCADCSAVGDHVAVQGSTTGRRRHGLQLRPPLLMPANWAQPHFLLHGWRHLLLWNVSRDAWAIHPLFSASDLYWSDLGRKDFSYNISSSNCPLQTNHHCVCASPRSLVAVPKFRLLCNQQERTHPASACPLV